MSKSAIIGLLLIGIFNVSLNAQDTIEKVEYAVSKSCYEEHPGDLKKGQECTEGLILRHMKAMVSADQVTDWEGEYFSSILVYSSGETKSGRSIRMPRWVGKGDEALIEKSLTEIAKKIEWMPLMRAGKNKEFMFGTNINVRIKFNELLQQK